MPVTRSSTSDGSSATEAKKARLTPPGAQQEVAETTVAQVVVETSPSPAKPPQHTLQADASGDALPRRTTFADAARGRKRGQGATPTFPRPDLVRGDPIFQHNDYLSMERPAPEGANPTMLYVDLRNSDLSPPDALEAAFDVVGTQAIGFDIFPAQKTVGLVFASADTCAGFVGARLGETGLQLYAAPPSRVTLRKLTLSGCPIYDLPTLQTQLTQALTPYGELVFLAPMKMTTTGWLSGTMHATLRLPVDKDVQEPPPTILIMGKQVIIDLPGQRRYCRHCESVNHTKSTCRQGQRQRAFRNQFVPRSSALPPPPAPAAKTTPAGDSLLPPRPRTPREPTILTTPCKRWRPLRQTSGTRYNWHTQDSTPI